MTLDSCYLQSKPSFQAKPTLDSLTEGEVSNYVSQHALLGAQWSVASSWSRGVAFPRVLRDSG